MTLLFRSILFVNHASPASIYEVIGRKKRYCVWNAYSFLLPFQMLSRFDEMVGD